MITGYEKPLYILPFDHRHSYITGVFHWQEPLTPEQVAEIVASKQVIYDGFKAAVADSAVRDRAGILVDEAFGAALLHDAAARGYITCVSTEKSGQDEFDFEYGDDVRAAHRGGESDVRQGARSLQPGRRSEDERATGGAPAPSVRLSRQDQAVVHVRVAGAARTGSTRASEWQPRGVRSRAASRR